MVKTLNANVKYDQVIYPKGTQLVGKFAALADAKALKQYITDDEVEVVDSKSTVRLVDAKAKKANTEEAPETQTAVDAPADKTTVEAPDADGALTKNEIIAKLEAKGIAHDPRAKKADLEALLASAAE